MTRHTYTCVAKAWEFTLAFWTIIVVGVTMAVVALLNLFHLNLGNVPAVIYNVCNFLALIIPGVMSYQVARSKQTWMLILWVVCVVLIVFAFVARFF